MNIFNMNKLESEIEAIKEEQRKINNRLRDERDLRLGYAHEIGGNIVRLRLMIGNYTDSCVLEINGSRFYFSEASLSLLASTIQKEIKDNKSYL